MPQQVIIEFIPDTSKLTTGVTDINAQIASTGKVSQQAASVFQEANKTSAAALTKTATEAGKLNDSFRQMGEAIPAQAMKEQVSDLAKVSESHVRLRTQLMNAKQALFELAEQGKKGTVEWNEQVKATERLAVAQRELQKQIGALGTQTKTLSGILGVARGAAAGFEAIKVAQSFAGGQSEQYEKTIKQLAQAMAALQAVQELQLLVEEESTAKLLVENGQRLAGVAATKLQTYAESENTVVRWLAVAAQTALNAVMDANPVALLIGGVAALVAGLLYLTRETETATDKQIKFNAAQKEAIEVLKNRVELEKKSSEERVSFAEQTVADLKAQKASVEEIRIAEAFLAQQRVNAANDQVKALGVRAINFEKYAEGYVAAQKKLNDDIGKLETQLAAQKKHARSDDVYKDEQLEKMIEARKGALENLTKEYDLVAGVIENQNKAISQSTDEVLIAEREKRKENLEAAIAGFKAQAVAAQQGSQAELTAKVNGLKESAKLQIEELANDAAAANKKLFIEAELQKNIADLRREYRVKILEEAKANFDTQNMMAKKGSQEALSRELQDLDRDAGISKAKLGNIANRAQEERRIDQETSGKKLLITKEYNDKWIADSDAAAIAVLQAKMNAEKKGSIEILGTSKQLAAAQSQAEIDSVKATVENAQLKAAKISEITSKLTKQLDDLDKQYKAEQINRDEQHLSAMGQHAAAAKDLVMGDPTAGTAEKIAAEKLYHEDVLANIKSEMQANDEKYANQEIDAQQWADKQMELQDKVAKNQQDNDNQVKKLKEQQQKEIATMVIDFASKAMGEVFAMENTNRNNKFNAQIATLERQRNFELQNANLTAAQKNALDAKYRKQEAAVKLAQWKADQKSKETQAGMSAALAVINALATTPYPLNIVTAAAAAATGIAEVATIAGTKPPQFYAKGIEYVPGPGTSTSDSIPAMLSKGERIVPAAINEQLKGIPNHKLPDLVRMPNAPELSTREAAAVQAITPVIDYKLMAKEIGKEINARPQVLVNIDKGGYKVHLLDGGNKREVLNNKYGA